MTCSRPVNDITEVDVVNFSTLMYLVKTGNLVCLIAKNVDEISMELLKEGGEDCKFDRENNLITLPEMSVGILKLVSPETWLSYNPLYKSKILETHVTCRIKEK